MGAGGLPIDPIFRANRMHRSRLSAAAGCAALASYVDIVLVPAHPGVVWPKALAALLSMAGLVVACRAWLELKRATISAWADYADLDPEAGLVRGWQQVLDVPPPPLGRGRASRGTRRLFWLAYVPALEVSYWETVARYGAEAGLHALRARKAAFASRVTSLAVTIFWLAYVNFYDGFRTWELLLAFFAVVIVAESTVLACGVVARREAVRQVICVAEATGLLGLTETDLPWRPAEYVREFQAHDLTPYPLGRPDWSDAQA